jgi:hypothetical protein
MKTRFMLVFMISILFQLGSLKAQENKPVPNENNNKTIEESATRLIVNKEMINRFNQCDTEGKLISWSDLVMGFDSQSLSELYLAYQSADLNSQTLEDIKMALEDKQSQYLNNSNFSDNDLAWFNQVKQEVNSKLRRTDMVVQR